MTSTFCGSVFVNLRFDWVAGQKYVTGMCLIFECACLHALSSPEPAPEGSQQTPAFRIRSPAASGGNESGGAARKRLAAKRDPTLNDSPHARWLAVACKALFAPQVQTLHNVPRLSLTMTLAPCSPQSTTSSLSEPLCMTLSFTMEFSSLWTTIA